MIDSIEQPEVYDALKSAVSDGLAEIRNLLAQAKYIGNYLEFPEMSWFESGLPNFSFSFMGQGPTDYKYPFGKEISTDNIQSWQRFWGLIPKYPDLQRYFALHKEEDILPSSKKKLYAFFAVESIIDHYIHINKTTEFDESAFQRVYVEWERSAFLEHLPFDVFVPLLYITFDSDSIDYGEGLVIERIPEPIQLARIKKKSLLLSRYESLTGSATHALILKDWLIPNTSWIERSSILTSLEAFSTVVEKIDLFMAALRAVTGAETGYNQLVVVPESWGDSWYAHLPDVEVVSIKAYPDHFETGGWLTKPPVIPIAECEGVFDIYKSLNTNKSNKLLVAARRLNAAYLRRTEDDAILDVTIGLESLLASDSRNEITYRLSVRLASLTAIERFNEQSPLEVFALCKKVYDYRSAVAHGSHEVDKKRIVRIKDDSEPVPAVMLGLSLLRYAIRIMSVTPELLDTKALDQHVLNQFVK